MHLSFVDKLLLIFAYVEVEGDVAPNDLEVIIDRDGKRYEGSGIEGADTKIVVRTLRKSRALTDDEMALIRAYYENQ